MCFRPAWSRVCRAFCFAKTIVCYRSSSPGCRPADRTCVSGRRTGPTPSIGIVRTCVLDYTIVGSVPHELKEAGALVVAPNARRDGVSNEEVCRVGPAPSLNLYNLSYHWGRSSAGEHCVRIAGVRGSNPLASTNSRRTSAKFKKPRVEVHLGSVIRPLLSGR